MSRKKLTINGEVLEHLPHGARVLVACSGGRDSCVLLHAVLAIRERHGVHCEVAHLDHGIRNDSHLDAIFVQKLARNYGIPFHTHRLEGPPPGENDEQWGRNERYRWLREIGAQRGLDWIVTGHTAADLAETFLMRLVSNKELRTITRRDTARRLIRPLLSIEREQIAEYSVEHAIQWREDPTNQDTDYLRNKVRHVLVPTLKKHFDPRIEETLSFRACGVAEDDDALLSLAGRALDSFKHIEFGSREWLSALREALAEAPSAIRWRMVEILLRGKLGFNLGRVKGDSCVSFFLGDSIGIQLPGGWQLKRRDGGIVMLPPEAIKSDMGEDSTGSSTSSEAV